ncbi:hypothetical protein [Spiroplasma apis]|uniref:Uncharacterized protein n=1 Tax=Spiroplasma apis B31 TaxID=1276258 RepID=V5RJZ1_SPIAP|nr:hypothetical protein [Spiroplasma apis]AHB36798.1 hypothetical protein SAPIS_v1c09530 [Spiroplasma apis B31]
MTKEEYKDKIAHIKEKRVAQEIEIQKCKETIKGAKLDMKIKKNELKNISSELKLLKSKWKKQEM